MAKGKRLIKNRIGREIVDFTAYVAFIFIMTFVIVHFVGQRTLVDGVSMQNTLEDGDNLIIDKISYRIGDPKRFDIVVFPVEYAKNTYYIKRVIGLPGETVQIDYDGNIYINGHVLDESYGKETIRDPGLAADLITLGEDEYFVLGDNRNDSTDSRSPIVGVVDREEITGRAWVRIFPFDSVGVVAP